MGQLKLKSPTQLLRDAGIQCSCDEDELLEYKFNVYPDDAGIGPYEYWGAKGFDSRPYLETSDAGGEMMFEWNEPELPELQQCINHERSLEDDRWIYNVSARLLKFECEEKTVEQLSYWHIKATYDVTVN